MSIYSKNGAELNACYSVSGEALDKAYNVHGVEIFSAVPPAPERYSINNVVSYFRDRTLAVSEELNGLSSDWQSFVFITDPHGNGNKKHSQAIALYLLDNTPAKFIVLNGDYFGYAFTESEYTSYMNKFLTSGLMDNIYALVGNHEGGVGGSSTWNTFAPSTMRQRIYNDFLQDKENLMGSVENIYFYFDDSEKKIRYMFINTTDEDFLSVGATQLSWIGQNVILPDSTWSLLVIGHVPISAMGLGFWQPNSVRAVKTSMLQSNGSIIGYLCGHEHCDYLYNNGSFEEVTIICDKFENIDYYPGVSVTDRVAGTVTEQAVSVVSINTNTKQVVIRRIGAGRNQTMSYSYS